MSEVNRGRSSQVFVILTGVSGNLGDAVIRRRVLAWSRGLGEIHAYVGRTTPGWVEELELREDEHVYGAESRRSWLRKLVVGRGKRTLVFDPGEVPLGRSHLKSEVMFLAVVLMLRIRGGIVIRPPRAVGEVSPVVASLYRASSRLSHVVLWRDKPSMDRMRVGRISPDTAFAEPAVTGLPTSGRETILISMRGPRPFPSDNWFAGIETFARRHRLKILVMSQVDEDETRSKEIADRFGPGVAEYLPWGARTDLEQEREIRRVYERTLITISDRLHVLILSAQAGSFPVEIAPAPRPKVRTHFETIGVTGTTVDSADLDAEAIASFLDVNSVRHEELGSYMAAARVALETEVDAFRERVTGAR